MIHGSYKFHAQLASFLQLHLPTDLFALSPSISKNMLSMHEKTKSAPVYYKHVMSQTFSTWNKLPWIYGKGENGSTCTKLKQVFFL